MGPLIFADPEWVEVALRLWRRLRRADVPPHPLDAARDPRWGEWMSGLERAQLLAMSPPDLWAFLTVVEAEALLIGELGRLAYEPDMRALIEQHRPQRGEP